MIKIFRSKKVFSIFFILMVIWGFSIFANAAFSDLNANMKYYDEASRISSLKIISGDDNNLYRPNAKITREQFVVALFKALGKNADMGLQNTESAFYDVQRDRWSFVMIHTALRDGMIKVNNERLFMPESEIKFAEAVTMALNVVYSEKISGGSWPESFIDKAYEIGLLKELKMQPLDKISRLEAAAILDRVWYLNDIKNGNFDYSRIDVATAGTEIIVTSDSKTNKKLKDFQVQTNKGVYRVNQKNLTLNPGESYRVFIYEDNIMAVLDQTAVTDYAAIKSAVGSNIRITDFGGKFNGYVIPEKISYYYNGKAIPYEEVKDKLSICASIVFAYNKEKNDYVHAVILDPVYSEPHVVSKSDIKMGRIATLRESSRNATIIRDGNLISFKDIEERDVLYKVTDWSGDHSYYLVMNARVEGKINDIKPNILAPAIVRVNNTDYDLGDRFPVKKLDASYGSFSKGSYVQLLMGYDNKVADIYDSAADYGIVINSVYKKSELKADNTREDEYFVKMISSDGIVTEYEADKDYVDLKGKLVRFDFNQDKQLRLEKIELSGYQALNMNKDEKRINERYAADNIKLFNIISNNTNVDAEVGVLRWSDLPNGAISWEKVLHLTISGDFEDVVLIIFNDLFEENLKLGYVKDNPSFYNLGSERATFNAAVYIDGKAYTYNAPANKASKGDVVRVTMNASVVTNVVRKLENKVEASKIDAYDARRIKVNGKVYAISDRMKVASIDKNNALSALDKDAVNVAKPYANITLFLENEFGSEKVLYMVIQE